MQGRPQGKAIEELQFTLSKVNNKYCAICSVCNKVLQNIAETRLKGHRNVRKIPPNGERKILLQSSPTDDMQYQTTLFIVDGKLNSNLEPSGESPNTTTMSQEISTGNQNLEITENMMDMSASSMIDEGTQQKYLDKNIEVLFTFIRPQSRVDSLPSLSLSSICTTATATTTSSISKSSSFSSSPLSSAGSSKPRNTKKINNYRKFKPDSILEYGRDEASSFK